MSQGGDEEEECRKCQEVPEQFIKLNCSHTFCLMCILSMETKNVEDEQNVQVGCELCGLSTVLDSLSSQALYAKLDNYIQTKEAMGTDRIQIQITHEDEPSLRHNTSHRVHTHSDYVNVKEHINQHKLSLGRDKKCPEHGEYDCINYCVTCNVDKLCLVCLQHRHEGHRILQSDSRQLASHINDSLRQLTATLEVQGNHYLQNKEKLVTRQTQQISLLQNYQSQLQTVFTAFIDSLQKTHSQQQQLIQEHLKSQTNYYSHLQNEIEEHLAVIDIQNAAINDVLEETQESELLQKYIELKQDLNCFQPATVNSPLEPRRKEIEMSQMQMNQMFSQNESSKKSILASIDSYVRKVNLSQLLKASGLFQSKKAYPEERQLKTSWGEMPKTAEPVKQSLANVFDTHQSKKRQNVSIFQSNQTSLYGAQNSDSHSEDRAPVVPRFYPNFKSSIDSIFSPKKPPSDLLSRQNQSSLRTSQKFLMKSSSIHQGTGSELSKKSQYGKLSNMMKVLDQQRDQFNSKKQEYFK